MNPKYIKYRNTKSAVFRWCIILLSFLCTIPLAGILFYIVKKGINAINWEFLTEVSKPVGESGGGILNAWTGSLFIVMGAVLIAVPLGVLVGIFLGENSNRRLAGWTRLAVDVLQGVPSVVTGIVVYFWIVRPLHNFSALSGSIALAIIMLPIVARTTEETLKVLPPSIREASLALGVPYQKAMMRVILPCGMSGILSGILLAIARVMGETAPLLFTAFGNPYLNTNIFKPMQSLPATIYNYAISPFEQWHNMAWGAAMLLLCWILLLNMVTKLITRKWKIQL